MFEKRYAEAYDLLSKNKDYSSEANFVQLLCDHHLSTEINSVLDLGCGSGLHLSLLPHHIRKTGVDASGSMLEIAKRRQIPNTELVNSQIHEYENSARFDLVLALYHVLSYQTTNDALIAMLQTVEKCLAPKGIAIIDFWHRPALCHEPPTIRTKKARSDKFEVARRSTPKFNEVDGIVDILMDIEISSIAGEDQEVEFIQERHVMRAFTMAELQLASQLAQLEVKAFGPWMSINSQLSEHDWYGWILLTRKFK